MPQSAVTERPSTPSKQANEQDKNGVRTTISPITVQDQHGSPIAGAQVLFVSPNGTHSAIAVTDADGTARLSKPMARIIELYCAHRNFMAFYNPEFDPSFPVTIHLSERPGVGSLIRSGEGFIDLPGIRGGFDPRTYPSSYPNAGEHYVYTQNLSINGQVGSLFPLKVGEEITVEDNPGNALQVILVAATGESFLIQYRKR